MVLLNSSTPRDNVPEFSVSELSFAIKRSLEQGFSQVRVRAECGRVTVPKSGHIYLDLKDKDAVINGIIWKGVAANLQIKPEEGLEVIATGKITTYPGQSRYQIIIDRLEPAGIGAILQQLEERKKRLAAEGLFDPARKRPIPFLPKTIGVVTSPTGAVIRDILHRISDRFPTHILLWRVLVQGDKAAEQISHAIEGFNKIDGKNGVPRPDLIIVARGGGSVEDLWCFNDEMVVRAAANSTIPLISAVGHETDTTLIDYASDLRAPTPTGAAEMAVPVRNELFGRLETLGGRVLSAISRANDAKRMHFRAISSGFPRHDALFSPIAQRLDLLELKLFPSAKNLVQRALMRFANTGNRFGAGLLKTNLLMKSRNLKECSNRLYLAHKNLMNQNIVQLKNNQNKVDGIYARLQKAHKVLIDKRISNLSFATQLLSSLDYHRTLERGFAIIKTSKGEVIKSRNSAKKSDKMIVTFKDGDINVKLTENLPIQGDLL